MEQEPYACRNYRPNTQRISIERSPNPHEGQVIADLYRADGTFYRSAVVADCGNLASAQRYCRERNQAEQGDHSADSCV